MSPHIYNQVASSNNHHEQDKDKTDRDGRIDDLDVRLFDEDLARLEAELLDLLLRDGLAPQQLLDLAESRCQPFFYEVSERATRTYLSRSLGILSSFCQGFRSSAFTRHDVRFARR